MKQFSLLPLPSTSVNEFQAMRTGGSKTPDKTNSPLVLSRTPHWRESMTLIEQFLWSLYSACWLKNEMVITTAAVNGRQRTGPWGGELMLVADLFVMCDNPGIVVVWTQIIITVEVKYSHFGIWTVWWGLGRNSAETPNSVCESKTAQTPFSFFLWTANQLSIHIHLFCAQTQVLTRLEEKERNYASNTVGNSQKCPEMSWYVILIFGHIQVWLSHLAI